MNVNEEEKHGQFSLELLVEMRSCFKNRNGGLNTRLLVGRLLGLMLLMQEKSSSDTKITKE